MKVFYVILLLIYIVCGALLLKWLKGKANKGGEHGKIIYFATKVLFVVVLLEVTIFNLPAFHLWLGDYEETSLSMSDAEIEGNGTWIYDEETGTLAIESGQEVSLYFSDINQPVGTIYMDVQFSEEAFTLDMNVDVSDETHQTLREGVVTQTIYRFEESSQTTLCHLSGDVKSICINLSTTQDDAIITVSDIRLNVPVSFSISIVRVFMLWLLPVLVYSLVNLSDFKKSVKEKGQNLYILTSGVFFIMVMLAAFCVIPKMSVENLREVFCLEEGDQITQELVDAFEAGSVSLIIEPDEDLEELSDPYDRSLRDLKDVEYSWDHVYYEGKYYSYYGIAPVILFFLPFHLLTGYYFSTKMAVLIFSVVGIWFLLKIYTTIVRKWFSSLPLGLVFGAEIVLIMACGIFYPLSRPKFYELAVSCAFMFLTAGVYFMLTSNILGEGRIKRARLAFSSVFFALAVLSRPTMAVYCICACVFYLIGFKKWRACPCKIACVAGHKFCAAKLMTIDGQAYVPSGAWDNKWKKTEHGFILYWLYALLPMALIGAVQMAYNYARFGSVFEFGIKYSLTINDFTNVQYHTIYVLILIYNYLLAPVKFSAEYPFISADFSKLGVNGYFFKDTGNTVGLLFMALPIFAYVFAGRAIKRMPKEKRASTAIPLGMSCVIMPFVIICAAWSSGYSVRYLADFSWEIIIGALLIIFYLYGKCEDKTKKRFVVYFMAFSAVWAIVVETVQVYNFCYSQKVYPYMAYELEQIIAFWK